MNVTKNGFHTTARKGMLERVEPVEQGHQFVPVHEGMNRAFAQSLKGLPRCSSQRELPHEELG